MSCKILFITFNDFNDLTYGGGQCSNRNLVALRKNGIVITYQISKKSTLQSGLSLLKGLYPPLNNTDINNILDLIKKENVNIVFFDGSLFGSVIKKVRNIFNKIKIITFFHNVESEYTNVRFGNKLYKYPYYFLAKKSEKNHILYSDKIVALNKRDSKQINNIYNGDVDFIIPITFEDKLNKDVEILKNQKLREKKYLYVGALRRDTLEGVKWFVDNVSPYVSGELVIVGRSFETKKNTLEGNKVEVIGTVDKLDNYYLNSACVILPILSGAGMKVKTAEALMYGRYIFGTTEAFEGYDINYEKIGGLCNSADEFISKINSFFDNYEKTIFNSYSREIYKSKYSIEASNKLFSKLINVL